MNSATAGIFGRWQIAFYTRLKKEGERGRERAKERNVPGGRFSAGIKTLVSRALYRRGELFVKLMGLPADFPVPSYLSPSLSLIHTPSLTLARHRWLSLYFFLTLSLLLHPPFFVLAFFISPCRIRGRVAHYVDALLAHLSPPFPLNIYYPQFSFRRRRGRAVELSPCQVYAYSTSVRTRARESAPASFFTRFAFYAISISSLIIL